MRAEAESVAVGSSLLVAARGFGGQFLLVDFDKKIVAVRLRTYKGVTASPTEVQKFRDFPEFLQRL